jgi:hypothetical protein
MTHTAFLVSKTVYFNTNAGAPEGTPYRRAGLNPPANSNRNGRTEGTPLLQGGAFKPARKEQQ